MVMKSIGMLEWCYIEGNRRSGAITGTELFSNRAHFFFTPVSTLQIAYSRCALIRRPARTAAARLLRSHMQRRAVLLTSASPRTTRTDWLPHHRQPRTPPGAPDIVVVRLSLFVGNLGRAS